MKLHEYQSKAILARHGIPVPRGAVTDKPEVAERIARELGAPVAVKAQVLVGGRGKAGGIRLGHTPSQAGQHAAAILGLMIKGLPVRKVLVEEAAAIERELYLGLVVDRTVGRVTLMASGQGGVEIEEVARSQPGAVVRVAIDPYLGLADYHLRFVSSFLGLREGQRQGFGAIARGLYAAFVESDASLAEINPLVLTTKGELLALDAKMALDDNALFRHPELEALRNADEETEAEREAREASLSYVGLEGSIGCMVNGAGLAMATLDTIRAFGGLPANFLDVGGGARAERVATALHIILKEPRVRVVLLNIFGGITRCDEVAQGVAEALRRVQPDRRIVARLVGTREAEGRAILAGLEGVHVATSLPEAARLAVELARG